MTIGAKRLLRRTKLYSKMAHRNDLIRSQKGGALIEYSILVGAIASVALVATTDMGQAARKPFIDAATQIARVTGIEPTAPAAAVPSPMHSGYSPLSYDGSCFKATDGNDIVQPRSNQACFLLGAGDDTFEGAGLLHDVDVGTEYGTSIGGVISTGSGHDRIVSSQVGQISAGAGDDYVEVKLDDLRNGTTRIDLGPGTDTLKITVPNLPYGLPRHAITAGAGVKAINADCADDLVLLTPSQGSDVALSGSCAYEVGLQTDEASPRTRILGEGLAGFSGTLSGNLDLVVNFRDRIYAPQTLTLTAFEMLALQYQAKVDQPVTLHISTTRGELHPASDVLVDIAAPTGAIIIEGAALPSWKIAATYAAGGAATLVFPDETGISAMKFPRLTGSVETLRVVGCFDTITLIEPNGQSHSINACAKNGRTMTDLPDGPAMLAVTRGGQETMLSLGEAGLAATTLITSASEMTQ